MCYNKNIPSSENSKNNLLGNSIEKVKIRNIYNVSCWDFFERSSFEFLLLGIMKQEKKDKIYSLRKKGFTLVEIMIVIAIIGILAGVVTMSSASSVEKSKRSAAITTMSSLLPELVICADDGGYAKSSAPAAGELVCCIAANACSDIPANRVSGHTLTWPAILAKTGYQYGAPTAGTTLALGTYTFIATKTGQPNIVCDYAKNSCE